MAKDTKNYGYNLPSYYIQRCLILSAFHPRRQFRLYFRIPRGMFYVPSIGRFRSRTWTSKSTQNWRQSGVPYPYIGMARKFHVALYIHVLDLNLYNSLCVMLASSCGRVVKTTDLKSVGRFTRRLKCCRLRNDIVWTCIVFV